MRSNSAWLMIFSHPPPLCQLYPTIQCGCTLEAQACEQGSSPVAQRMHQLSGQPGGRVVLHLHRQYRNILFNASKTVSRRRTCTSFLGHLGGLWYCICAGHYEALRGSTGQHRAVHS